MMVRMFRRLRAWIDKALQYLNRTPGCDCDQNGNPDPAMHAFDCRWLQRI